VRLGYRREGHREINRVTKIGDGDGSPELDRQARHDRRRAGEYAAIFEIVVGPNLAKAELSQRLPGSLGKPDQFGERVTIENVKGIMDTDFPGKFFCLDNHTGAAITAS
jgi:hypothetical protein